MLNSFATYMLPNSFLKDNAEARVKIKALENKGFLMVEVRRVELLTFAMPLQRSTN